MLTSNAYCVIRVNASCVDSVCHRGDMPKSTEKPEPSEFWKRVVETWAAEGLPTSQSGIASVFGTKQSTVQRWCNGSALPERSTLIKLAERGKTTLDYLIAGRMPKRRGKPDDALSQLEQLWTELDEKGRLHILDAARGQLARCKEGVDRTNSKSGPRKIA